MGNGAIDTSGLDEVAKQYAEARNLVREWSEERGLSLESALRWVAGYANEQGMFER